MRVQPCQPPLESLPSHPPERLQRYTEKFLGTPQLGQLLWFSTYTQITGQILPLGLGSLLQYCSSRIKREFLIHTISSNRWLQLCLVSYRNSSHRTSSKFHGASNLKDVLTDTNAHSLTGQLQQKTTRKHRADFGCSFLSNSLSLPCHHHHDFCSELTDV